MRATLLMILAVAWPAIALGQGPKVIPDRWPFDNDDAVMDPLLAEGVVGVQVALVDTTLACDCLAEQSRGDADRGYGWAVGASYDKAFGDRGSYRLAVHYVRRMLGFADGSRPITLDGLRAEGVLMARFRPSNYLALTVGGGPFGMLRLPATGEPGAPAPMSRARPGSPPGWARSSHPAGAAGGCCRSICASTTA